MPVELTKALIACPSVTPKDEGCQALIAKRLDAAGFKVRHLPFGEVSNCWATLGEGSPVFCFVGHTDVVPAGDLSAWNTQPFEPVVKDGKLYGRGSADMKSAVAAMVVAAERFVQKRASPFKGTIAFLITSDEEGPSIDGTKRVVEVLQKENQKIDWCLVGEPSSEQKLGDVIKYGRRGSLSGQMRIFGKQGHVAYPTKALNPIHQSAGFIKAVSEMTWDQGDAHFVPTSFQISNIHAGTGANNVIPGFLDLQFNLRFSPSLGVQAIKTKIEDLAKEHGLKFEITWTLGGEPFITDTSHPFIDKVTEVVQEKCQTSPKLCTHGGTSDGRFIAPMGAAVIEFGLINESIHQVNEHAKVEDIERLCEIYEAILERCLIG